MLTERETLAIAMLNKGACSGKLREWPKLFSALEKLGFYPEADDYCCIYKDLACV